MCGCDGEQHTHTHTRQRVHNGGKILPLRSTTDDRHRERVGVTLLPVTLLFTRCSWHLGFSFTPNQPPAGCLNHPLINPSVGSLLRPQPSEEGSNPAMQAQSEESVQGEQGGKEERIFQFKMNI